MADLLRDSVFGKLIRLSSRGSWLQYAEEKDPSIWTRFIDEKASGYLAYHGDTNPPADGAEMPSIGGVRTRENQSRAEPSTNRHSAQTQSGSSNSSQTRGGNDHRQINHASGVPIDPEKGRDLHVVSWYGPDDPGITIALSLNYSSQLMGSREPAELECVQEILRHSRDLPAHYLGIYWILDILCRHRVCGGDVWRL